MSSGNMSSLTSPFSNMRLHQEFEEDTIFNESVWLPGIEDTSMEFEGKELESGNELNNNESDTLNIHETSSDEYEGANGTESIYRRAEHGLDLDSDVVELDKDPRAESIKEQKKPSSRKRSRRKVHVPILVTGEARKIHVPTMRVPSEGSAEEDYESFSFLSNDEELNSGTEDQNIGNTNLYDEISLSLQVRDELLVKAVVEEFEKTITPKIEQLKIQASKYERLKTLLNVPSIDAIQSSLSHNSLNPLFDSYHVLSKLQNPRATEVQKTIERIVHHEAEESKVLNVTTNEENNPHKEEFGEAAKKEKKQETGDTFIPETFIRPTRKVRVQQANDHKIPESIRKQKRALQAALQTIQETSFEGISDEVNSEDKENVEKSKIKQVKVVQNDKGNETQPKHNQSALNSVSLDSNYERAQDQRSVRELSTEELKTIRARIHNGSFPNVHSKNLDKLIAKFEKFNRFPCNDDKFPCEYSMKLCKMNNVQLLKCIDFELYYRNGEY